jgi:DNA-binding transcriptional regulator GbsR (MarR family)
MTAPEAWQLAFIERVSAAAELNGLPPSHAQVLAWLVVCEPSEQSVDDLRQALGLSAGAVSMATAALLRLGLIERIAHPGHRRMAYRLHHEGWQRLLRLRLEAAAELRAVADEALLHAPAPADRLSVMRDMYAWFEEHAAVLLDRLAQRDQVVRGRSTAVPSTARSTRSL